MEVFNSSSNSKIRSRMFLNLKINCRTNLKLTKELTNIR